VSLLIISSSTKNKNRTRFVLEQRQVQCQEKRSTFLYRNTQTARKENKEEKKKKTRNPSADRKVACQTNRDEKLAYNGKPTEQKGPCETEVLPLSKKIGRRSCRSG
jgi:hypothetical protein